MTVDVRVDDDLALPASARRNNCRAAVAVHDVATIVRATK
jgi:hypothetical protein